LDGAGPGSSLQQQVVRPVGIELEDLLPRPFYPFYRKCDKAEDELLEPEGGLYKVQPFGHVRKYMAVEVAADGGHYKLLRIKSDTTLQKLRDEVHIRFSHPEKKHIVYNKDSINDYLEAHVIEPFNSK